MRFPVLVIILSFLLSGCLGFFDKSAPRRSLTPDEIATQQREAEGADALVQAMQLQYDGDFLDEDAAEELLDKAVSLDPDLTGAWFQRAILRMKQGRVDEAYSDLEQVLRIEPNHPRALYGKGYVQFKRAEYDKAIRSFDKALRYDDSLTQAYGLRGAAYSRLGNNEQALSDFTQTIGRSPANRQAYYNRGIIHAAMGEYDLALHDLTQAVSLDLYAVDALLARAKVYVNLDQMDEAIGDYHQAIAVDPGNDLILERLAATYAVAGLYREAEATAHRAMVLARTRGDLETSRTYADQADAYAAKGEPQPAQ